MSCACGGTSVSGTSVRHSSSSSSSVSSSSISRSSISRSILPLRRLKGVVLGLVKAGLKLCDKVVNKPVHGLWQAQLEVCHHQRARKVKILVHGSYHPDPPFVLQVAGAVGADGSHDGPARLDLTAGAPHLDVNPQKLALDEEWLLSRIPEQHDTTPLAVCPSVTLRQVLVRLAGKHSKLVPHRVVVGVLLPAVLARWAKHNHPHRRLPELRNRHFWLKL